MKSLVVHFMLDDYENVFKSRYAKFKRFKYSVSDDSRPKDKECTLTFENLEPYDLDNLLYEFGAFHCVIVD